MNELQNLIKNSVKNPSYFQQLNINDLIDDCNIKDELLNILQIIVTNSTKQNNQLKNYIDDVNLNIENKINDINDSIKEINNKLISSKISINSINSKLDSNKVIEVLQSNTIKISLIEKDFKVAQNKYDKIFLDNLFMPNLISRKGTKFKNLKELINNNYEEISKINLVLEKFEKNIEAIKEKQSNLNNYLAVKKMQDFVEQRIKTFEDDMNSSLKAHLDSIDKNNKLIHDGLQKKKKEFDEYLDTFKNNLEEEFNIKFNNEHNLIESQMININQLREFDKEFIKKNEKLEKMIENQKLLVQKYIRYFELYKYRENFFLHKDNFNKEKRSTKKLKKLKGRKYANYYSNNNSIYNEKRNKNTISFNNEEDKSELQNFNLLRNNSVELYNQENVRLINFYNLINDKQNESNILNNNNINNNNNDNYLSLNSELILTKNNDEKQLISPITNDFPLILSPFISNMSNKEKQNNFTFEKYLTEPNKIIDKNDKIRLKKAHLFNHQKLTKLSVNNTNNNNNENNNLNLTIKNTKFFIENNIIKDDIHKNNNKSKIENLSPQNNNANETSSYFTIDNYMENKLTDNKKENNANNTNRNNMINKLENSKFKEDKTIQKNRFFKLNVLKFGNLNLGEKKIIEGKKRTNNKNNKNTKIKIVSKSLPYKKDKNKILKLYDFTNNDYIKIIEKNKIKRVNTVKKYHLSKKY